MTIRQSIKDFKETIGPAILNSYSAIFFLKNRVLATVILAVSFFNFFAGLSGIIAVITTVLFANTMGFDKFQIRNGYLSFNALLVGIGMGTFFDPGFVFFSLLLLASLTTLIISVTMGGWLYKYGLPFLSIPFVITFWFITLPASQFTNLGLTQHSIFWINEVYAVGGNSLVELFQKIDNLPIHNMLNIYLRSISSIFFQDNLIAGVLLAIALLISSRIAFSLSIIGFVSAYLFAKFTGSAAASLTYYNIGANYMMTAIAVGGFFTIPSKQSYLWSILLVPLTSLILLFLSQLAGFAHLPVFSLPFSIVVILFIYFLKLRVNASKLILTPIQFNSPEVNLYSYQNNKERLSNLLYFPIHLPFWGEWTVSQGHDGMHTHKGDWGKAFDFMIYDQENKTYKSQGLKCEDYYCYNKPVLAPADGVVEEVVNHLYDNEIGAIDTINNWGNAIIIRHANGLYTQMAHLKRDTFKVKIGDFVKRGDVIAHCGNSGRSPIPHLHFQVQTTAVLGARTIDYPFAYYFEKKQEQHELQQFSKPLEGELVSGLITNKLLYSAFDINPNSVLKYHYENERGEQKTEEWEAFTDAYNSKYLYCKSTNSSAFYVNDGSMFYFTSYYGDEKSLLYYFYLSAFKVFLGDSDPIERNDSVSINILRGNKIAIWLHDFMAPLQIFIKVQHTIQPNYQEKLINTDSIVLKSTIQSSIFGRKNIESESSSTIQENKIQSFTYQSGKTKIKAKWLNI
ncbi:MAG: urea transporter [Bacteroidia bacterium]|nr:urea transporter [Bacteroidia bacterium]